MLAMKIKTPSEYINEPGLMVKAGQYIAPYGRKPLIIGGAHALKAAGRTFFDSLAEAGINAQHVETFAGYPSARQFETYAALAAEIGADCIIGIGGGRAVDTSKGAAMEAGLPVITIPTVAATCAAWAALVVQYDDEGAFVKMKEGSRSPVLVLCDTKIILEAPVRYLFSGVVDTYAKFYEGRPLSEKYPENFTFKIELFGAGWAFERLQETVFPALEEAKRGEYGQEAQDTVDAIIYVAGLAGSFRQGKGHYSYAHPFYHCSTRLPGTRKKLHGEKVAFGILAQLALEQKPDSEILDTVRLFDRYDAAFTLEDIGISGGDEQADLDFLADDIPRTFPFVDFSHEAIVSAMRKADRLVKQYRREKEQ